MSGGSHNYLCYRVEGWKLDEGLGDMLRDVFEIVEWCESGDTGREQSESAVYERVLSYMNGEVGLDGSA
jgi:hypothetical protein